MTKPMGELLPGSYHNDKRRAEVASDRRREYRQDVAGLFWDGIVRRKGGCQRLLIQLPPPRLLIQPPPPPPRPLSQPPPPLIQPPPPRRLIQPPALASVVVLNPTSAAMIAAPDHLPTPCRKSLRVGRSRSWLSISLLSWMFSEFWLTCYHHCLSGLRSASLGSSRSHET